MWAGSSKLCRIVNFGAQIRNITHTKAKVVFNRVSWIVAFLRTILYQTCTSKLSCIYGMFSATRTERKASFIMQLKYSLVKL